MQNPELPPEQRLTPFEWSALSYSAIASMVAEGRSCVHSPTPAESTDLPLFSIIRCICGNNENKGELIQCHSCHSYLHAKCVDPGQKNRSNFKCPFCRLQLDGIDPFRDLSGWIQNIDNELKTIYHLVNEASNLEQQYLSQSQHMSLGMGDYNNPGYMRNPNNAQQVRNTLSRKMQEIIQHISALTNT